MRVGKARGLLPFLCSRTPRSSSCSQVCLSECGSGGEFRRSLTVNFSTSSSSSPNSHPSHSQWRRHDEESKSVKVAVWWDFENCSIPSGVNAFVVPHRIASALRAHGIRGPISITAFGDVTQLSRSTQDALCASGVCLNHVPNCGKNSSDRSLLADLVNWVAQNPPPVHFFLISGDGDFSNILHRLRMSNYNILLAGGDVTPGALCSAATVMWQWNALARGENLTGKHFNHPPDGLQGSWYGQFKGALENPFSETEQPNISQTDEATEINAEAKPRQIPRALTNAIRQVLFSHPEGITVSDLRAELKKSNVVVEKDFFGHKKFSHLLLSMPSVLRFKFTPGDAQPLVHGVQQRSSGQTDPISKPQKSPEKYFALEDDLISSSKNIEEGVGKATDSDVTSSCKDVDEKSDAPPLITKRIESAEENTNKMQSDENAPRFTLLHRILEWFTFRKDKSIEAEEHDKDISKHADRATDAILPSIQPEIHNLFSKSHFWDSMESFLGTAKGSDLISNSKTREELMRGLQKEGPLVLTALKEGHICHLVKLLIEEKKWVEESISHTYPFKLVLPTRQLCIRVNGLRSIFSDKTSRAGSESDDISKAPKNISELRTWFSRTHETKGYERQFEAEFGKKIEPLAYGYFTLDDLIAACSVESEPRSCLGASRVDTLADCKNLLSDFLKHHPRGFNIGLFRPMFFKRYGYVLDYQSLGYPKLASLLLIMPGVRVESSIVLPAEQKAAAEGGEDGRDEKEQAWEELGPLSDEKAEVNVTEKKTQTKDKSVSALLEVLDGYYSRRREGGKEEEEDPLGKRRISFVSDVREEVTAAGGLMGGAKKLGESTSNRKLDALGT